MTKKIINIKTIGFCVVFLFCVSMISTVFLSSNNKNDENETTKILQELENRDITQINKEIKKVKKKLALMNQGSDSLKVTFCNSVIVGDSIAEGLIDYDILDASEVYCKRGLRIDNCDDYLKQALQTYPDHIFLEFGMNDIKIYKKDIFIKNYEDKIKSIKDTNEDIEIYVIGMLPVKKSILSQNPEYKQINTINQKLKSMCERQGIHYINCKSALDTMENKYEKDGLHPKAAYYPKWAQIMKKKAGL